MNSFTDFKKDFYSRVNDFALFDCGDINLLKVVLDGLKVNYVGRGQVRPYLFFPLYIYNLFTKIKTIQYRKDRHINSFTSSISAYANRKYLVSDAGRIINGADNLPRSIYFDNIVKSLGRENVVIVADKLANEKLDHDFDLNRLTDMFIYDSLLPEEKKLRSELIGTYIKIKKAKIFSKKELANIQFAIHRFFNLYKVWNRFLNTFTDIKTCYFVCHYHKEGQIYALKKHGIKCTELQHGLIAPQDIFYVFPEKILLIKNRTLFADKILVYGKHWKEVLLKGAEYSSNQIDIIGYYHYNNFKNYNKEVNELNIMLGSREVILITTQTFLHEHFINYTKQLANDIEKSSRNIIILLKPHPSEDENIYKKAFLNSNVVKIIQYPLPLLFEKAKAHISIFSTTLYDAIRYNVKNYVFKVNGYEDYVNEILSSGIAKEVMIGQNPLDLLLTQNSNSQLVSSEYYYERLNEEILTQN